MQNDNLLAWLHGLTKKNTRIATDEFVRWLVTEKIPFVSHPLGFFQYKFWLGVREFRLNVWLKSFQKPKDPNWPIHSHAYCFESRILIGNLSEVRYRCELGLKNPTHEFSTVDYLPTGSKLSLTKNFVHLSEDVVTMHLTGEMYSIKSSELHETTGDSYFALSLMEIVERSNAAPLVMIPLSGKCDPVTYVQELISPEILASKISLTNVEHPPF